MLKAVGRRHTPKQPTPTGLSFGEKGMMSSGRVFEFSWSRCSGGRLTWMSPEECTGEDIDHRSALYTLGITLYAMIAGRLPFEHADKSKLLAMQREAPPPPFPSSGSPPSILEAICRRLLAKVPDARYPSAAALLEVLRQGR
jgi:serine/threonine protein kinase